MNKVYGADLTTTTDYQIKIPGNEERIIQIALDPAYYDDRITYIVALTNRGRVLVRNLYNENTKWFVKLEGKLKVYGEE